MRPCRDDTFPHSPQSSAPRHMGKEWPQFKVRAPPHLGHNLPGWWENSKLFARANTEPGAARCSAAHSTPMQDGGHRPSAWAGNEAKIPPSPCPLNIISEMLARTARPEEVKGTRTGEDKDTALFTDSIQNPKQGTSHYRHSYVNLTRSLGTRSMYKNLLYFYIPAKKREKRSFEKRYHLQ